MGLFQIESHTNSHSYDDHYYTIEEKIPKKEWNEFRTVRDHEGRPYRFRDEFHAECFAAALKLGASMIAKGES